jgi:hypothetical protein
MMRRKPMRKLLGALLVSAFVVPGLAFAGSWDNAALIDQMCAQKEKVAANPEKHPTSCLLKCADSGYGIKAADGKFLKLDKAGSQMAMTELKKTKKENDVRVNVTGDQKGDTIHVTSLKIAD